MPFLAEKKSAKVLVLFRFWGQKQNAKLAVLLEDLIFLVKNPSPPGIKDPSTPSFRHRVKFQKNGLPIKCQVGPLMLALGTGTFGKHHLPKFSSLVQSLHLKDFTCSRHFFQANSCDRLKMTGHVLCKITDLYFKDDQLLLLSIGQPQPWLAMLWLAGTHAQTR